MLGLYDKHISRQDYTKRALAAELNGDYVSALQIYNEATQLIAEVPSKFLVETKLRTHKNTNK